MSRVLYIIAIRALFNHNITCIWICAFNSNVMQYNFLLQTVDKLAFFKIWFIRVLYPHCPENNLLTWMTGFENPTYSVASCHRLGFWSGKFDYFENSAVAIDLMYICTRIMAIMWMINCTSFLHQLLNFNLFPWVSNHLTSNSFRFKAFIHGGLACITVFWVGVRIYMYYLQYFDFYFRNSIMLKVPSLLLKII